MNHSLHIRRSTAVLAVVIAGLIGGLAVSLSVNHTAPVLFSNAHAAGYEQGVLTTFAPVVKHVMPAVVNISSSKVLKNQGDMGGGILEDPFLRRFFGGRMPQEPRERRAESRGSGVIVSPDGYILTNNHVVEGATHVKVSFNDQREFPAKVIGTDKPTDVAVLKIDQRNLPVLPLSDSSRAQVGDVVLAIGNPFALGQTVTMGIVSATGRGGLGIEQYEDFIQTDAAINPGNSGGALINTRGELVGINTAILAGDGGGNQGIGFAIPINLVHNIMDQILKNGKVTRGFMGILPQEVTPDIASGFGNPNLKGVAIAEVEPNSPAQKAGLQVGDVITAINGTPITDVNQFRLQIAGMAPGTKVNLKINHNGREENTPVTLAELTNQNNPRGEEDQDQGVNPGTGEKGALDGVSVQSVTPDLRRQLQIPASTHGVVVTEVDQSSRAADAGLQQGDLIEQVNRKPVNTVAEFNAAVRAGGTSGSTLLLVHRGQGAVFIVVQNH